MTKVSKRYNITAPKEVGEKTYWNTVGTLTEFDNGNMIVEIPLLGQTFQVFEQKKREEEAPV